MTFESLAFVGSDEKRVSAGPRALTSEAGLGPPLPEPLCLALPGFSNSRALPTETPRDTQPPFPGAIRGPRREPPIPEALTHRGSPESGRCAESSAPLLHSGLSAIVRPGGGIAPTCRRGACSCPVQRWGWGTALTQKSQGFSGKDATKWSDS